MDTNSTKPFLLQPKSRRLEFKREFPKASRELMNELDRQRMKMSFDSVIYYETTADELDLESFRSDYERITGKRLDKEHLINIGLVKRARNRLYPTNAAVLLSDSHLRKQQFYYAKFECARFKGTDKRLFLDQRTIEGPIPKLAEPCIDFVKKKYCPELRKIKQEIDKSYPEIELIFEEMGYGFQVKFVKKFVPYRKVDKISDIFEKWRTGQQKQHSDFDDIKFKQNLLAT